MNHLKWSLVKRIFVFMLCTMFLSSIVFFSYENTMIVMAVDESDLVYDAVIVSLAAIGVFVSGGTLGTLALAVAPALAASGKDIYDYVTENEDGTTTISEDFVNLVLQAYKEYKEDNGEKFDGTMLPDDYGYYHYDSLSGVLFIKPNDNSNTLVYITDINTYYPCAILVYSNQLKSDGVHISNAFYIFYDKITDKFYTITSLVNRVPSGEESYFTDIEEALPGTCFLKMPHYVLEYPQIGQTFTGTSYYINGMSLIGGDYSGTYLQISSSSLPVYHSLATLKEGLRTGDFSMAFNYWKAPEGETSSYTGIYEGGDITVNTEKLDGISDKLAELEESNNNIEDILKAILEWLKLNGGGSGSDSSGSNVTVNIDLNTTNGWLSKIYSKVSQIYDKISSSVGGSMDEVAESIENLRQMLKNYLSEITGDLDDIKGQLEEMTEQEFSEKTESFLDDTLDSFSEISEKAKGKFPFSIPNDIRLLISKMSVSPPEDPEPGTYSMHTMTYSADHGNSGLISVMDEGGGDALPVISETGAPIFYIPFVIASAGIDQYVVIDLSGFESISSFCRSLMTIFFILCLFNLTFKVMGLWGDLVD